jgi:hypothetical protein
LIQFYVLFYAYPFCCLPEIRQRATGKSSIVFKNNLIYFNLAYTGVDKSKNKIGNLSQWLGIKNTPGVNSLRKISAKKKNVTCGYNLSNLSNKDFFANNVTNRA